MARSVSHIAAQRLFLTVPEGFAGAVMRQRLTPLVDRVPL